jgi:hypothetical protein
MNTDVIASHNPVFNPVVDPFLQPATGKVPADASIEPSIPDIERSPRHAEALRLAAEGIPVFPCVAGGKAPATQHGFQDKTTDPAQINAWWAEADYNLGIVPHDMGLAVVDLDLYKRDGVSKVLLDMLPATRTHRTPQGGEHRLYLSVEGYSNRGLGVNADVRSANGYILWPPSVVNGAEYRVVDEREHEMLPEAIRQHLGRAQDKTDVCQVPDDGVDKMLPEAREWCARYADNQRGDRFVAAAALVRNFGLTNATATELCHEFGIRTQSDSPEGTSWERTLDNARIHGEAELGTGVAWQPPPNEARPDIFDGFLAADRERQAQAILATLDPAAETEAQIKALRPHVDEIERLRPFAAEIDAFQPAADGKSGWDMIQAVLAKIPAGGIRLIRGGRFTPKKINWLWDGWLACGKYHVLAGPKGAGKSTVCYSLAATVSVGGLWPDDTTAPRGDILIWSAEDDFEDTILPRFMIAGGDRNRLIPIGSVAEETGERPFDPSRDIPRLRAAVRELPDLKLIIIDPVVSAVSGDSHKNAETRRGLQPLVDLADHAQAALIGITHFSKGTDGKDPVERVTGSLAFGALARVVLAASVTENGERRLVRSASNIGPDGGGFEYSLSQEMLHDYEIAAQRVLWGRHLHGKARELLDSGQQPPNAMLGAVAFVTEMLKDGPVSVRDMKAAAVAHGLAWRTVERAKEGMPHIGAIKGQLYDGMSPIWQWVDTSRSS